MGIFQMGPPINIVLFLKENFRIKQIRGNRNLFWAIRQFGPQIVLILFLLWKIQESFSSKSMKNMATSQKVNFAYGIQDCFLSSITSTLNDPAIFWLDSHWCGGNSYGEQISVRSWMSLTNSTRHLFLSSY